jgi:hypothetical protein
MNRLIVSLALAAIFSFPHAALAGSPSDESYSDLAEYSGSISDKYNIGMTLIWANGSSHVTGVYFYDRYLKDIKITGTFTAEHTFELDAYDDSGEVTDTFIGSCGQSQGGCQLLTGKWHKKNSNESLPFTLNIEYAGGTGTLDHRYAGVNDDRIIENAAQKFWHAIKDDNRQVVASLIQYPFECKTHEQKIIRVHNQQQFLSRYEDIITTDVKLGILTGVPHHMFSNYRGVALSRGVVWLNTNGKVFEINPR